jgi:hypothetical protein
MTSILAALVALLKGVPAIRDVLALFVQEWHNYDERAREKEAAARRDAKLKEADQALSRPQYPDLERAYGGPACVFDGGLPKPAPPIGGQPHPDQITGPSF